jgi:hypothetical protein
MTGAAELLRKKFQAPVTGAQQKWKSQRGERDARSNQASRPGWSRSTSEHSINLTGSTFMKRINVAVRMLVALFVSVMLVIVDSIRDARKASVELLSMHSQAFGLTLQRTPSPT